MQIWRVCSHGPIIAVAVAREGRARSVGSLNIELGRLMARTMPESAYALRVQQCQQAYERAVRRTWQQSPDGAELVLAHTNAYSVRKDERPRKGPVGGLPLLGEVCIDDSLVRSEVNARREMLRLALACEDVPVEELRIIASRRGMKERHPFVRHGEAPRPSPAALEAPKRQRERYEEVLRRAFCLVFGDRAPWVLGQVRTMEAQERLGGRKAALRRGSGRFACRVVVAGELAATLIAAQEQPLMAAARDLGLPLEGLTVEMAGGCAIGGGPGAEGGRPEAGATEGWQGR